jgi:hypothetical protein
MNVRWSPLAPLALALVAIALGAITLGAGRAHADEDPDPQVRALADDLASASAERAPRMPYRASAMRRWIARLLAVPDRELASLPARGRRGALRWRAWQRRTNEGLATYLLRHRGGDCPSDVRDAWLHDRRGRLMRFRHVAEACEYVDARITEERFVYDAAGRLREVVRIEHAHPVHVEALEDQRLTPDLTLPDGTMPPALDPLARCVRLDEGPQPSVWCGTDERPRQIELREALDSAQLRTSR